MMEDSPVTHGVLDEFHDTKDRTGFTSEGDLTVEDENGIVHEDSENSEESDREYGEISDAAREEMTKLERIFQKKGFKFRMIDRIGEGMFGIRHLVRLS